MCYLQFTLCLYRNLQNVVSPTDRAMATAIFNVVMSITGDGPGPWLIGQVKDRFNKNGEGEICTLISKR